MPRSWRSWHAAAFASNSRSLPERRRRVTLAGAPLVTKCCGNRRSAGRITSPGRWSGHWSGGACGLWARASGEFCIPALCLRMLRRTRTISVVQTSTFYYYLRLAGQWPDRAGDRYSIRESSSDVGAVVPSSMRSFCPGRCEPGISPARLRSVMARQAIVNLIMGRPDVQMPRRMLQ